MKIFTTPRFEKRLELFLNLHPDYADILKEKMKMISKNPFAKPLSAHKLSGILKNCFAAKITHNHRIVFTINKDELCFIDIGSHDQVY